RRRAQPRLRFRNTLLGFTRGNLCTTQSGTGALGLCASTLLRQLHLDLGPTQVGGRHRHGSFRLFDPRLTITRVELSEEVIAVDGLVVDDVDGQNRAIDLRTQRDEITDDVGIVCRFMCLVVLPQVPAIGDTDTEQDDTKAIEYMPGPEQPTSRPIEDVMQTRREVRSVHRRRRHWGTARHPLRPLRFICHSCDSICRDDASYPGQGRPYAIGLRAASNSAHPADVAPSASGTREPTCSIRDGRPATVLCRRRPSPSAPPGPRKAERWAATAHP